MFLSHFFPSLLDLLLERTCHPPDLHKPLLLYFSSPQLLCRIAGAVVTPLTVVKTRMEVRLILLIMSSRLVSLSSSSEQHYRTMLFSSSLIPYTQHDIRLIQVVPHPLQVPHTKTTTTTTTGFDLTLKLCYETSGAWRVV